MNTDARKRIIAARTAMILDEPFFGTLALRLALVEDLKCKTAWVNGRELGYSPQFVLSLTHAEVVALLIHEVMHCAAGHPWRRGARDRKQFNKGADLAINPEVRAAGYKLPACGLFPEQFSLPEGKSAEWYCDRLPTGGEEEQQGGSGGAGQSGSKGQPQAGDNEDDAQDEPPSAGGEQDEQDAQDASEGQSGESESNELGEVRDAPTTSDADGEAPPTEEEWKQAVQQAAVLAQAQGKLPGTMKRFAEKAAKSRVDWRSALRRFVQEAARADYSWSRPNPRYALHGLYMPSLHSEEMGPIVIGVDTSGSIDQVLLSQFAAEVQAVVDEMKPRRLHVMYADAKVQAQGSFERDEPIVFAPAGGGGTDFRPLFDEVAKLDDPPVCVVYLTDLYGTFPEQEPDVPTLWVTAEERIPAVPFGEVVSVH